MALTKLDLNAIKKIVRLEVDDALEQKLEEKLGKYPTKDEFYISMDKLMKELETIRQELILTPSHSDFADLEERIIPLEEIHPDGKHLALH
jgi:hypothetical protein